MKKLILSIALGIFTIASLTAQNNDQEIGLIGSILKSEIKVFFAQNIELASSEANLFWEIYEEYEEAVKPVSRERIKLMEEIIKKGGELTQDELDAKIILLQKSQKKRFDLRNKYYKVYKKKLSVKVAAQFYQIDSYIYTHIAASLNEGMPLVKPKAN